MNPADPIPSQPIALQLWTIREALAADMNQALARTKGSGFTSVELAPLPPGLTMERLVEGLHRHDLTVLSIHGDLLTAANREEWLALTRACNCSKILWHGWPRDPRFDSLAGVRDLIGEYNQAATIAHDLGLQFGIHNHWWEFEPVEGEAPIRLFAAELHPDLFFQTDVYWAQAAGVDPISVLQEFRTRIGSLHLKDGPAIHSEPMRALGQGVVNLAGLLGSLTKPVDWVIELDECATDPLEAARESLGYLRSQPSVTARES